MAKQIKQFRYYADQDPRNYPNIAIMTAQGISSGLAFADYMPISQLAIQALPGTEIRLNNSEKPIVVGYTGIYELKIDDLAEITSLKIECDKISVTSETALLVDIIYEEAVQ